MVVPVHLAHLPAEARPLLGERLELLGVLGTRALLETVAVDDGGERVEVVVRRRHGRLPVAALLELAITEHDERAP